jgi:hypothetical protein
VTRWNSTGNSSLTVLYFTHFVSHALADQLLLNIIQQFEAWRWDKVKEREREVGQCTYHKSRSQNYWVFGLFPSSGILKTRKLDVSETGLFSSSGEGETPTLLGSLERANLNHWTEGFPPSPEDGNRPSFRNVVFSSFWNTGRWTKSKNPVILNVIHHRQNPSEIFTNHTNTLCD